MNPLMDSSGYIVLYTVCDNPTQGQASLAKFHMNINNFMLRGGCAALQVQNHFQRISRRALHQHSKKSCCVLCRWGIKDD